jgi:mannan endo-1,4-beta-mannosidase
MRSCGAALQSWLEAMAPYVKGLDPNHLLTIGEEGFYSAADVGRGNSDPEGASSCAHKYLTAWKHS